jgi:hypothetical protein
MPRTGHLSLGLPKHSGTSGLATNQAYKIPMTLVCVNAPLCTRCPPLPARSVTRINQEPCAPQSTAQTPIAQSPGSERLFDFVPPGKRN